MNPSDTQIERMAETFAERTPFLRRRRDEAVDAWRRALEYGREEGLLDQMEGRMKDKQLVDLIPLFIQLSQIHDCRDAIKNFVSNNTVDFGRAKMVCDALLERQERERQL